MAQTILILDFGGQYKELIARRVRECNVYSIVKSGDITPNEIREINPIGIILTGGPNSVYDENSPHCDKEIFNLGIPVLGICYGTQLLAWSVGGTVEACSNLSEYGKTDMIVDTESLLYKDMDENQIGLMSHTDQITVLPEGFRSIAHTDNCKNASIENIDRKLYGVQYHPEVESTPNGTQIIRNFLYNVCGALGDYNLKDLEAKLIEDVRAQVGDEHVLLALSGGVDSSVCAALLSKAIPGQLHCVFVDHGLMRKNEGDEVEAAFANKDLDFIRVNAKDRFLKALDGVVDPEQKRKIIGAEFVKVFEAESEKLPNVKFLAQGTIYPDVIESGGSHAATIKSHHNVGGLPKNMQFTGLVEPLRGLFKDEVRILGRQLGLSADYVDRQPFPGPGLGVRIMGEITEEKIKILQEADAIFREEMKKNQIKADQFFAVLTDTRSVGVVGDFRTFDYTVALRAVKTSDFMTCEYVPVPHEVLGIASSRIVNEVDGAGRVVYDITGKPPATIEWC
ncbi:MAG: glutamine-hydrolyzing GMP synthase [Oscillospiraceae bacterium]|nr:glutamine-hydrolyzing GMP synthase [Candidatus Limimonas coprohippi]